jgi:hypothetical protein
VKPQNMLRRITQSFAEVIIRCDPKAMKLDIQGFKSNKDPSLLATITKSLLNMTISQVKMISNNR